MSGRVRVGDRVRQRHNGCYGEVLEVACGGALLRYDVGGPFGNRGRRLGVLEHLIDLERVIANHDPGDEDRSER